MGRALGRGLAGGWVQARHEAAICPPNGSRKESEPQAPTRALRLIVPSLSVGFARLPAFLLVRLSEYCPRRNYTVSRASISSEQAVFFTPGPSTASPFYLFFDFTWRWLHGPAPGTGPPVCAASSRRPPWPSPAPHHAPDTLLRAKTSNPQRRDLGLAWQGPSGWRELQMLLMRTSGANRSTGCYSI